MALKKTELLLLHNVEHLGIVGDVVKVRTGYARNYLVPMGLAEVPTEERITELQADREAALAQVAAAHSAQASTTTLQHLRPGRPEPTHRLSPSANS